MKKYEGMIRVFDFGEQRSTFQARAGVPFYIQIKKARAKTRGKSAVDGT